MWPIVILHTFRNEYHQIISVHSISLLYLIMCHVMCMLYHWFRWRSSVAFVVPSDVWLLWFWASVPFGIPHFWRCRIWKWMCVFVVLACAMMLYSLLTDQVCAFKITSDILIWKSFVILGGVLNWSLKKVPLYVKFSLDPPALTPRCQVNVQRSAREGSVGTKI